jgi:hypothetical protein
MLQLPSNALQAVVEDTHEAPVGGANRTRRYSMMQLQSNAHFGPGAVAASAGQPRNGAHRGPLRAASWGANAFREVGVMGVHSPTRSFQDTPGVSTTLDAAFTHQVAVPAGGPVSVGRMAPVCREGPARPRSKSMLQGPGPHSLGVVAEESGRPTEEHSSNQRHAPNRAASWASQTFAHRVNIARRGSVDLPRPVDAAATANGYDHVAAGAAVVAVGEVPAPPVGPQHSQRSGRARRNSVEAPKWAGAFWNPMVSVIQSYGSGVLACGVIQ